MPIDRHCWKVLREEVAQLVLEFERLFFWFIRSLVRSAEKDVRGFPQAGLGGHDEPRLNVILFDRPPHLLEPVAELVGGAGRRIKRGRHVFGMLPEPFFHRVKLDSAIVLRKYDSESLHLILQPSNAKLRLRTPMPLRRLLHL